MIYNYLTLIPVDLSNSLSSLSIFVGLLCSILLIFISTFIDCNTHTVFLKKLFHQITFLIVSSFKLPILRCFNNWWIVFVLFLMNISNNMTNASYISRPVNKMCNCGIEITQQKFCDADFVIVAKRVGRSSRSFHPFNIKSIPNFQYSGEILKFRLLHNLKGPYLNYTKYRVMLNIHVIRSINCKVNINFKRHKPVLLSGYKQNGMLFVTSCTLAQNMDTLSGTQLIGLFGGFYQNYCYFRKKCGIKIKFRYSYSSIRSECNVQHEFKECYDKYSICQYNGISPLLSVRYNTQIHECSFLTSPYTLKRPRVSRLSPLPYLDVPGIIRTLPASLRTRAYNELRFPNGKFIYCLKVKKTRPEPWWMR